jgi:uncharacterized membrane protein YidH (DUF202 family)
MSSTITFTRQSELTTPLISAGTAAPTTTTTAFNSNNAKLDATRRQIDEVTQVMRVNIDKVLERDTHVTTLLTQAEELEQTSSRFERAAKAVKRKFMWQNIKGWLTIAGVVIVVVGVIVLIALV